MRADRRHELKENDLSHAIASGRAYLKEHGKGFGMVALAVVAVVAATSAIVRSREATAEDHWRQKAGLSFEADVAKESLETLMTMANESDDPSFVLSALVERGANALRLAAEAETGLDPEYNRMARDAYEALLERFEDNPLAFGIAHRGLVTVEENDFVLDGDLAHKERGREHLTAIVDNPALNLTPFHRMARDRLDVLDATFTQIVFAPPLPPEEPEEPELPEMELDALPGEPSDLTSGLRRIEPPDWAKDLPPLVPPTKEEPSEADQPQTQTGSADDSAESSEADDSPPAIEEPSGPAPDDSGTTDPDPDETS